jgi:apolipoprotein D and lipocalin family protein
MKTKLLLMSFVLSLCMSTTSCIVTRHHHRPPHKKEIPPGHAKKIHGHKSAKFDVRRFMGKWYEIARYDHRFEKGMTHVTATYSLQENGSIKVKNEGYKNGKHKEVEGRAKQPNPVDPGKLKVSFFLWFYSDYYVLDIDPDYRYVLIGSSSDKYLWIMSRDKTLSKEKQAELFDKLRVRGYDTEKLLFVDQN